MTAKEYALIERALGLVQEYAWHTRSCRAVDGDGEWRQGNPDCDCGYDKEVSALHAETLAVLRQRNKPAAPPENASNRTC